MVVVGGGRVSFMGWDHLLPLGNGLPHLERVAWLHS